MSQGESSTRSGRRLAHHSDESPQVVRAENGTKIAVKPTPPATAAEWGERSLFRQRIGRNLAGEPRQNAGEGEERFDGVSRFPRRPAGKLCSMPAVVILSAVMK